MKTGQNKVRSKPAEAQVEKHASGVRRSGVQRAKIYELIILGELMGGPHHGYLLRDIVAQILGPFRSVSWGVLYPLLSKLVTQGHIQPRQSAGSSKNTDALERGRGERNLYDITAAGRARLQTLMTEAVPFEAYDPDLFIGKLGYIDFVDTRRRLEILRHHLDYLQVQVGYLKEKQAYIRANEYIPERERDRIAWVIDYRFSRIQAEARWIDAAIKDMSSE